MAESIPHEVDAGHGDHHHEEQGFVSKYLLSTDHKIIAMQYMFTGMLMAVIGGFMSYVFRMQLAFPGGKRPALGRGDPGQLQRLDHQPRHDHDFLGRDAGADRSLRQLPDSVDGRRGRHGVSEAESP